MVMLRANPETADPPAAADRPEVDLDAFAHRGGIDPLVREPDPAAGPEEAALEVETVEGEESADGQPIDWPVIRTYPGRRTRRQPWLGRVVMMLGQMYRATLFDGTAAKSWCWPCGLTPSYPRGLPPEAVVWAESVLRNFRRDPKAAVLDDLLGAVTAARAAAGEFLADHHPPCRCGVCDMLAARDLRDPANRPGAAVVGHARRLYAELAAVERTLSVCTTYRQDESADE